MARVKTFTQGGTLLPGDLNAIEDDYEGAFSQYRVLRDRAVGFGAGFPASTCLLPTGQNIQFSADFVRQFDAAFYFDPADYPAAPRQLRTRVRSSFQVAGTGPGANFTVGLFPVAFANGGAGTPLTMTAGALLGNSIVVTTPVGGASGTAVNTDFQAPVAGWYALGIVTSAAIATGSSIFFNVQLQYRHV